ncbi:GerW family sporulation protein [Virgibacillus sp. DJP39]|uniref:GerW family sporulation protein n=1 Tax=Virgibacillus sp. DJP39 TaxID=3409790 RepID=UPI003BB5F0D5
MSEHPIQGLMKTAMENIKDMIEVNTIIGEPVELPDGVIIPVSKVGFGFAAGGSEFQGKSSGGQSDSESELPFGGGSGGGVSITPVAFLIVSGDEIKMVHLDGNTHIFERMIDFAPQVAEKVQQMLKESSLGKSNQKNNDKEKQKDMNKDDQEKDKKEKKSKSNYTI